MSRPGPVLSRDDRLARNAAIAAAFDDGRFLVQLAVDHGISLTHAGRIVAAERRRGVVQRSGQASEPAIQARNQAIIARKRRGEKNHALAKAFGVSQETISQVIGQARRDNLLPARAPNPRAYIIRLSAKLSPRQIAKRVKVTARRVRQVLIEAGIDYIRDRPGKPGLPAEIKARVRVLAEDHSLAEIAREIGSKPSIVWGVLERSGLKARPANPTTMHPEDRAALARIKAKGLPVARARFKLAEARA